VVDGLLCNPSFLGKLGVGFFGSLVGFYGSLILAFMFFFLGLYLLFSNKLFDMFKGPISFIKKADLSRLKLAKSSKIEEASTTSASSFSDELDFSFDEDLSESKEKEVVQEPVEQKQYLDAKQKTEDFEVIDSLSEPLELVKSSSISKKSIDSLGSEPSDKVIIEGETESKLPSNLTNTIWEYPPLDILNDPVATKANLGNTEERKAIIEKTLNSFAIKSQVVGINPGPAVTQYALRVDEGTKTTRITNLQNDLALALASPNGQVRIEAPIPGKSLIGIEVPNVTQQTVYMKPMLQNPSYKKAKEKSKLSVILGKDVGGKDLYYAINKMPHLLVAGATGSGKSIMILSIIASILFSNSPDECKFIMVDPKRVELGYFNDIPHLITPVITEPAEAVNALKWVVGEMDKRLKTLANFGARNIDMYNEKSGFQAMPYIVVVIDELADLMMTSSNDVERYIVRIAQLSRATGIHLVLATQRPSTDIITGSIKANIPARIAFSVASQVDSRVIIDTGGAEKLLGKGDMLFVSPESSKPSRVQGVFTEEDEVTRLVNFLKASNVDPQYNNEITSDRPGNVSSSGKATWDDDLFPEAVKVVVEYGRGSASLLQRRLSVGYARAARILDELEDNGVVSSGGGSKSREVLIDSADEVLE
jgi:S-DNA-T family DNA segregation ATPase FtsK/SpoIIIE